MDGFIVEEQRKTPVYGEYDVLVAGGGVAGISAALAAARQDARVILIEREYVLGGLATLGLVTIYLPLCDGMGNQVIFGIGEELLRLSIRHGAEDKYPAPWLEGGTFEERKAVRFEVQFNPHLFAIEAEQLLLREGVTILYGAVASAVSIENGKIRAVIIETKGGRKAILAKSVVDATGDADICYLSNAKTAVHAPKNPLAAWYYQYKDKSIRLRAQGFCDVSNDSSNQKVKPLTNRRFLGLDAKELSEMVCLSHSKILDDFIKHRKSSADLWPVSIPTIPQVRMTRRLDGACVLDDNNPHKNVDTSIGLTGDWRKRGPVFAIPFEALYGNEVKNLIASGRCISVTDSMWDITRVIPCCAVTGQAAGTAAAITDDFPMLDVRKLQRILVDNGVKISF